MNRLSNNRDLLTLNNISHIYNQETQKINVLNNINIKVLKGEMISLIGPSGTGKSTLLNILSLIDRPNSGSISIDDKQINFDNQKSNDILRSKKIGIIYQQDNLLPDFTSLENIYLAGLASGKSKDLSMNKAKSLLKKVGLFSRSDHYPSQLSGGEKQRISIARAVINDPQIILADEPTGSLDMETAKNIFELLKKQINSNRLIIFATHNRFFANKSDCLLEIVNGNIRTINAWV